MWKKKHGFDKNWSTFVRLIASLITLLMAPNPKKGLPLELAISFLTANLHRVYLVLGKTHAGWIPDIELDAKSSVMQSCLNLGCQKNHCAPRNSSLQVICFKELSNRPLEHTPNPQPTVYEGIPFIWGFVMVWGCLGYAPGVCWGSLRLLPSGFHDHIAIAGMTSPIFQ